MGGLLSDPWLSYIKTKKMNVIKKEEKWVQINPNDRR
jgi:hypothetical protein